MYETSHLLCSLAAAINRRWAASLRSVSLAPSDYSVLAWLGSSEVESQTELAAGCGVDQTSLIAVLDRLEQGGYVCRCASPRDRRRNLIRPMRKAIDALEDVRRLAAALDDLCLAPLDTGERAQLHGLLLRLAEPAPSEARLTDEIVTS